jgi:hypothetical protein
MVISISHLVLLHLIQRTFRIFPGAQCLPCCEVIILRIWQNQSLTLQDLGHFSVVL